MRLSLLPSGLVTTFVTSVLDDVHELETGEMMFWFTLAAKGGLNDDKECVQCSDILWL